ncbi:MAG: hypothetical protein NTW29_10565 [Bacteroidetes bacterium]|nr:hypothetical protein [Bacteroidota bacterium]
MPKLQQEISRSLIPYNDRASLIKAFTEFIEDEDLVKSIESNTRHIDYLHNYLKADKEGLNAKCIIVEYGYISQSYLDDYLNYYAFLHKDYARKCSRVHFFSREFSVKEFDDLIKSRNNFKKRDTSIYLGYVVIKPIPNGNIGTTMLRTYQEQPVSNAAESRNYTAISKQRVTVFGINYELHTLPFMQQDGITSICASQALWFALHKTNELWGTPILSPSSVTIHAGLDNNNTGKVFPNKGLSLEQVANVIRSIGLVAEIKQKELVSGEYRSANALDKDSNNLKLFNDDRLKAYIYAYNRMGIPVLLGLRLLSKKKTSKGPSYIDQGYHLVTVNGYRIGQNESKRQPKKILNLRSDFIKKLFAHDDQVGPFAKIEFNKDKTKNASDSCQFTTSWKISDGSFIEADAHSVVVPLIKGVKVTFDEIYVRVVDLTGIIKQYMGTSNFFWDIYLVPSEDYKSDLREKLNSLPKGNKTTIGYSALFKSLPKYIWVASYYYRDDSQDDLLLFDFIYDAADARSERPFYSSFFDANLYNLIMTDKELYEEYDMKNFLPLFANLFPPEKRGDKDKADRMNSFIKGNMEKIDKMNLDIKKEMEKVNEMFSYIKKNI